MIELDSIRPVGAPKVSGELVQLYLESPSKELKITTADEMSLVVKGWVLPNKIRSDIRVILKTDQLHISTSLSESKPYVPERYGMGVDYNLCGFRFDVSLISLINGFYLSILIGDEEYEWLHIRIKPEKQFEEINNLWRVISKGKHSLIDTFENKTLEFKKEDIDSFLQLIKLGSVKFRKYEEIRQSNLLNKSMIESIASMWQFFSNPSMPEIMANQIDKIGYLEYSSGKTGRSYRCDASFLAHDINFLRFSSGSDVFYLIQHVYSSIGIYYPALNIAVSWAHWADYFLPWISNLNYLLYSNCRDVFAYLSKPKKRNFSGFIIANARPFHFYYDQLPMVEKFPLQSHKKLNPVDVILLENYSFLSANKVWGKAVNEKIFKESSELNASNFKMFNYSLLLGGANGSIVGSASTSKFFRVLAERVFNGAYSNKKLKSRIDSFKRCSPIVWIGVAAQKRIWLEQEDGLINIITELSKTYPKMAIVFDGWTCQYSPRASDLAEVEKDKQVMQRIVAAIPKTIKIESLIGASSEEKIAFGSIVDFYITNWLQGTLHVDNICHKPGVGHFNSKWRFYENMYYHFDCLRVDDQYIQNQGDGRADLVSYSIPWQRVYERVQALISTLPAFISLDEKIKLKKKQQSSVSRKGFKH